MACKMGHLVSMNKIVGGSNLSNNNKFNFIMQQSYQTTRELYAKDKIVNPIRREIEEKIQKDPYYIGSEFQGKHLKG
jgi:hypothetical protein